MDILISNADARPIYEQIASQIKSLIMTGALQAGDALPSMRLLAKELRISVITTKRAYEELEQEGFLETVTGKGSFVAAATPPSSGKASCIWPRSTWKRRCRWRKAAAFPAGAHGNSQAPL